MNRFLAVAFGATVALAAATAPAAPVAANDMVTCFKGNIAPDAGIAACNRLIASGKVKGAPLANAYAWRATYFSRKGDIDRALSDADARIRLTPVDANAFQARASFWLIKRDYDRAVRDADEAVRLNPKDPDNWNTRGFAKQQAGDFGGAVSDYSQAIRINPKAAGIYSNRGNARQLNGDLANALADHDRAVALDPKDATYWYNRAGARREAGQLDAALADAEKAAALAPKLPQAQAELGLIWRLKNDLPRAMAAYDRAIALDPNLISAYAARGLAHESKGDINSARRDFQAALSIATGAVVKSGVGGDTTYFDAGSHRYHEVARARLAVLNAAKDAPASPVRAQAGSERRVALVIGNGAYTSAGALANPAKDATAIARNLRSMGFDVSEGIDLKRADMTRVIGDFLRNATNARIAVLFYAGHGIQIDGKNYLLPIDARVENGSDLASDMTDLDTILAGLDDQVRTNIVILDACRDNPTAKAVTQVAGIGRSVAVRSGLAAPSGLGKGGTVGAGTLLAFATAPGQVALDGDGDNSPFSSALSRHIGTPGLEVQQMLTRVRAEVVAATRNKQVPWSNSSLLGEVFLVGGKP
ncbi:tetratricopeptide repeat protein [Pseudorhodoplanes sp.]|uniref:caspase family protein n=1 Tax=Pseudorhodoplanes sp. TaxID=1934341 RepID=UPI002BA7DEBF|nr:tetratricopeptide repeat protein [Pseudorhodoplanes sp.]HWV51452.1 tetratricopeptide repeat protein [Pseudorhodoplanes sp.]